MSTKYTMTLSRLVTLLAIVVASVASAQIIDPIKWSNSVKMMDDTHGVITFTADIEDGWHLYGLDIADGVGPKATRFEFDDTIGVRFVGSVEPSRKPLRQYDAMFDTELSWWNALVEFRQEFEVLNPDYRISGYITYQGCNDMSCLAPNKVAFTFGSVRDDVVASVSDTVKDTWTGSDWWAPIDVDYERPISQSPWWYIFIWGFVGGLMALLTPCVWPLIPMTMSFFLKQSGKRGKAVRNALTYGVSIVMIYLILGLIVTAIFGAGKLNEWSTNAVFNLIFFALLVVFAISFFGAFDINLPEKWRNSIDAKAERTTGLLSIFFMAFTLALVSFSCTGPIIGTLLVEAASMGDITGPAVGMGAFALALALPFTLFAFFPAWLQSVPRSGGWLNSVKVVLGFLELALALKFLSVADLAYGWHVLDREVFIALWIVIFVLLGMYVLGKITFAHDTPLQHVSVTRLFVALISWSFAIYLLPGLWGAPLKGVSAFVPPLTTQDFSLYQSPVAQHYDDFDEGMRVAAAEGKPVLVDFSGYGCVNCRKMEGAVFDTDRISAILGDKFVVITLMVDDKHKLRQPITVTENGRKVTLETIGDKWSYLQRYKFRANSQPYYMLLDNDGRAVSRSRGYDENIDEFETWLQNGLDAYENQVNNWK